jgi:PKD repeat protein
MKYKIAIKFALCSLLLVVIFGCGEDLPIFTETLEVRSLTAAQSSIGAGETTIIESTVSYTGDETVLLYRWSADVGTVQGSNGKATYIAPENPGTYTISLRVTDGVISDEKTTTITVGQQSVDSLILDLDTHWPALDRVDKLAYNVNIKSVTSGRILLYYDITQDKAQFDAILSIEINGAVVLEETAIGAIQPSTDKRTKGDIDVTGVITGPGRYVVTFYLLMPGGVVNDGWLMNEAKITGVQGTSDPQQ